VIAVVSACALLLVQAASSARGGQAEPVVTAAQLKAAIDNLGKFDAPTRTSAARTVRRAARASTIRGLAM
jgi:hypothetical protein